ncbi:MAG TPA: carboxypeptidase-like regulatory domain-containing protein [Gemmatimonadales bacterium]|jgi:hypothetical protein
MKEGMMLVGLLIGVIPAAHAQGTGGATMVSGRIFDDTTGCPLKGVKITATGASVPVISDVNGRYRMANPPSMPFSMLATLPGYQTRQADSVMVTDSTARVDFSLLRAWSDSAHRAVHYPAAKCHLEPPGSS